MAEIATIAQAVQIGVEVTPGTAVAANRKLLATSITPGIKVSIKDFKPVGGKYATLAVYGKEWTEGRIEGQMSYTDLVYLLAGNVAYAAPDQQGSTAAYLWEHESAQSAEDTIKTYTTEQGSSVRAHKNAYTLINMFGYTITRDECKIRGSAIGNRLTDGITMTATPTEIESVPVAPDQVCIYCDEDSADLGTTKLTRVFNIDFENGARFGAVWPVDCALDNFAAHVETEPKAVFKLLTAANAQGMDFLNNARVGTKLFFRVEATGAEIDTGENYLFQHDVCATVADIGEFRDEQGVYAIEWTFNVKYDETWGKAFYFAVKNALTGL
jgi:hypothetical protein